MGKLLQSSGNFGITVIRVVTGIIFLAHGYQKLFVNGVHSVAGNFEHMGMPLPTLNAALASSAEFGCGLMLAIGLLTRLAAIPLAIVMVVAFLTVHGKNGLFLDHQGYEYVLELFAANVALMFLGSGPLAADRILAAVARSAPQPAKV